MNDDRIPVTDPAFMRRAGRRAVRALIIILILTSLFTIGGVSAVIRGEMTGIPLAVGAGVLDLACIALVVSARRVTSSLDDHTISRTALTTARRTTDVVRRVAWFTIVVLLAFGVARLGADDWWTLVVAVVMSAVLFVLARAVKRLRQNQDQTLARTP